MDQILLHTLTTYIYQNFPGVRTCPPILQQPGTYLLSLWYSEVPRSKPKATFRFCRYVSSPFLHRFTCKSLLPRFHGLRIDLRYSARAILSGCAAIWAILSKSAKKRPWETTRSGGSHGNQGGGCKSKYTGHILHLMRWESRCLLQYIDTFLPDPCSPPDAFLPSSDLQSSRLASLRVI